MNEQQHPERRAGQRWKMINLTRPFEGLTIEGTLFERVITEDGRSYWTLRDVVRTHGDAENSCMWESNFTDGKHECTLLSPAPAAGPDRTGCKTWCGMAHGSHPRKEPFAFCVPGGRFPMLLWCTEACRDARVPPLPAAPVTAVAKCAHCGDTWAQLGVLCPRCKAKPAANDLGTGKPAQEAPKAPVCMWHERHKCNPPVRERVVKVGAISLCDWAMHQNEKLIARKTEGSGTPYTGPERLPNPRLAVDYVDDCLGDV